MRLSNSLVFRRPFASTYASCIQTPHTHIYAYTHTRINVNVYDNYLFVPNAVLTFGQMYPHALAETFCGQVWYYFGSGWHSVRPWGKGQVDILLDSQSASQPCDKMSTNQTSGWSYSWWEENWGPDHIGPQSKIPALPLVPLGGVTYLTKARQVTQMSSAALYIPLAILSGTFCSFVSTWPNHIFLHQMYRNAIRTVFSPGQFTHILPPSIWYITTPRCYFLVLSSFVEMNKFKSYLSSYHPLQKV